MKKKKILIAGAGASGLMAARELSRSGFEVVVIEALDRIGGRIHTIHDDRFPYPPELGAEFIHGKLPLTMQLLKEYGLKHTKVEGKFFNINKGEYIKSHDAILDFHSELEKCLKKLKEDMTVDDFLSKNFPEPRYEVLRNSVIRFVQGYDTAQTSRSSILAFKEEWLGSDEEQYRIEGGYLKLIEALKKDCLENGCRFEMNKIIKTINWKEDEVRVITTGEEIYNGQKIIISFSLGCWQKKPSDQGGFIIDPDLTNVRSAASQLGFGAVIKIILLFENIFWDDEKVKQWTDVDTSEMGFIFSNSAIPTWWTQMPNKTPVLTGWLGGPRVSEYADLSEEKILESALKSIENIFGVKPGLKAYHIVNWTKNIFINGSYSYSTINAGEYINILKTPVMNTIYLAGEAVYSGDGAATVEAALVSGKDAAERILMRS